MQNAVAQTGTGKVETWTRPTRARRGRRARRIVARAATLLVGILIGMGSGHLLPSRAATLATPGNARCATEVAATTTDYLVGAACPPPGFARQLGYEPVLVRSSEGWRFTRPSWADGRCNGPIRNRGPFWDFAVACRTHDYGYDLVRFGIGDRAEADALLYRDMLRSCERQRLVGGEACRALADWTRTTLQAGDAMGFDPEPLASV
jgi:hypothetical protein